MSLAVIMPNRPADALVERLRRLLPEEEVVLWPDIERPQSVTFAVLWKQQPGTLQTLPALRAVMSYGAGVDFILDDPGLRPEITVARTVTEGLIREMREHVAALVLSERRRLPQYWADQQSRKWRPAAPELGHNVAILGLGTLGLPCALQLSGLGFEVTGFSRCRPANWGGDWLPLSALQERVPTIDFLCCLLPLTRDTRGLLNADLFAQMREGSCLINVSRGELLNESDLLEALERGRPGTACLDVFETEPLPRDHAFWSHPSVNVTPHIAALTDESEAAELIAKNFRLAQQGQPMLHSLEVAHEH